MQIRSERLKVEIAEPGVFPANTSRFDWCGFINSVRLDDTYEFCAAEPTNLVHPSTGGVGLCNEYLCPEYCDEVSVGEKFIKFGIGLFKKPDKEKYCFYRKYEIDPFQMTWNAKEHEILFYTEPAEGQTAGMRQVKRICVDDNELTMEVEIENTGMRDLEMEEFCHNFLTIEGKKTGPEYELDIRCLEGAGAMKAENFFGMDGRFSYKKYCEKAELMQIGAEKIRKLSGVYEWTLKNKTSPVTVRCEEDFCPSRIDIWTIDHIISVETFYPVSLKPGETTKWTRKWIFQTEEDVTK